MRQLFDFADFGGNSSHISASLRYCATGMMAMMALMARTRCHQLSGLQQWIRRQHINDPHHVILYQAYLKIVIFWHFWNLKKTTKKWAEPEILDLVEVPSSFSSQEMTGVSWHCTSCTSTRPCVYLGSCPKGGDGGISGFRLTWKGMFKLLKCW